MSDSGNVWQREEVRNMCSGLTIKGKSYSTPVLEGTVSMYITDWVTSPIPNNSPFSKMSLGWEVAERIGYIPQPYTTDQEELAEMEELYNILSPLALVQVMDMLAIRRKRVNDLSRLFSGDTDSQMFKMFEPAFDQDMLSDYGVTCFSPQEIVGYAAEMCPQMGADERNAWYEAAQRHNIECNNYRFKEGRSMSRKEAEIAWLDHMVTRYENEPPFMVVLAKQLKTYPGSLSVEQFVHTPQLLCSTDAHGRKAVAYTRKLVAQCKEGLRTAMEKGALPGVLLGARGAGRRWWN